jgi:heat shock protein HslJ
LAAIASNHCRNWLKNHAQGGIATRKKQDFSGAGDKEIRGGNPMRSVTYLPQLLTVAVLSTAAVAKTPSLFPLDLQFIAVSLNGQSYAAKSPTLTIKHDPKTNALTGAGFAGCNQWIGRVTLQGEQFSVANLGATKMFCTGQATAEANFLTALKSVTRWSMDGPTLVLEGDQTKLLLAPAPAKDL